MSLDTRTTLVFYTITAFACAVVIGTLWLQNRKRFSGLGYWVLYFIFQFTGTYLIGQRDLISDFTSIVIGNTLLIYGGILLFNGLERFAGKDSSHSHNYLLVAGFVFLHSFFTHIQPNQQARSINFAAAAMLIAAQIAWLAFHRVGTELRKNMRTVGILAVIYCVTSILRMIHDILHPPGNNFLTFGAHEAYIFILYALLLLMAAFALYLMVNLRLITELATDITKREQTEMELQISQQKFFKAFHSSPDSVIISRMADAKIVEVNEGFCQLMEHTLEEALGKSTVDLQLWTNPQDRGQFMEMLQKNSTIRDAEFEFQAKSGRLFTGLLSAEIIQLRGESHIISVIRDVTERKKAERSLRNRNEALSALHQMALDLINRREIDDILQSLLIKIGALVDASHVSIDLLEGDDVLITHAATPGQPLQKGDRMRKHEGGFLSWQAIETRLPAVVDDYQTWPKHRASFDDFPIHAILIIPIVQRERVIGAINFLRTDAGKSFQEADILIAGQLAYLTALVLDNASVYAELQAELVERRRMEDALRASEEKFRQLVTSAPDAVLGVDQNGKIVLANIEASKLLGYSQEELDGLEVDAIVPSHAQEHHSIHRLNYMAHPKIRLMGLGMEIFALHKSGSLIPVDIKLSHLNIRDDILVIAFIRDVTEQKNSELQLLHVNSQLETQMKQIQGLQLILREQALHDPLTNLHNRRYLDETIQREFERTKREKTSLSVILMDIDHFKNVNDSFGHEAGDKFLVALGKLLNSKARSSDIICRYGGEEFLLVMPDTSIQTAVNRSEEIRKLCSEMKLVYEGHTLNAKLSFGIAAYPHHGIEPKEIIARADEALYQSKKDGRNRVTVWEERMKKE